MDCTWPAQQLLELPLFADTQTSTLHHCETAKAECTYIMTWWYWSAHIMQVNETCHIARKFKISHMTPHNVPSQFHRVETQTTQTVDQPWILLHEEVTKWTSVVNGRWVCTWVIIFWLVLLVPSLPFLHQKVWHVSNNNRKSKHKKCLTWSNHILMIIIKNDDVSHIFLQCH